MSRSSAAAAPASTSFPSSSGVPATATGDYAALASGSWDGVVDVSGYVPRHVREAGEALGDRGGRYLFISTGSVYDRLQAQDGMTEDAPRLPPERDTEEITDSTYGPLKVACEDDVRIRYGDRATIVRPGVVAGRSARPSRPPCAG